MLETAFPRPRGDAGNTGTYSCNVEISVVKGATVKDVVARKKPEQLLPLFIESGRKLVRQGCDALTTTCGFLILFQKELTEGLDVPVLSSSLLQLPLILEASPENWKIGIITADSDALSPEHMALAGAGRKRLVVEGMQDMPEFRRSVLNDSSTMDREKIEEEVVEVAGRALERGARILLLECTNLPPYSDRLRRECRVPVFDFVTMIEAYIRSVAE